MKKILNKDFREETLEYLLEAGVPETDAKELIKGKYKETLREVVVQHLIDIANTISTKQYDVVKEFISFSPAGDGYGCDNYFIDFSKVCECKDIGQVMNELLEGKDEFYIR